MNRYRFDGVDLYQHPNGKWVKAEEAEGRVAELEAVQQWHPIETAPKDAPILAWCDHEADPFIESDGRLTLYAAHAEGLSHAPDGLNIIEWGGGFSESQEDGGGWLPDWWFVVGSEFEQAANPTHWMPLPDPPK